jgi:hypothetical protein
MSHPHRFWPQFILVCFAEGLIALAALFAIPGGGLSLSRLALAGILVLLLAGLGWIYFQARKPDWRARWLDPTTRPKLFRALLISASLLFLTSGLLLFLLRYLNPEATALYFVRVAPLLFYLLLVSAQTALWLTYLTRGVHPSNLRERKNLIRPAAIFFGMFIFIWLVIYFTGLGVTKDPSYWGEPGVPILGWQVVLALLVGFFFLLFTISIDTVIASCQRSSGGEAIPAPEGRLLRERFAYPRNDGARRGFRKFYFRRGQASPEVELRDSKARVDIFIALAIWLIAFSLWMSVPLSVLKNSSYAPIQPPSNGPFPASDAILYDSLSQSILAGNGFLGTIPPRPLYILFLAGLHALFGQDYGCVILGQTLVFALLPVAMYFLGQRLHSRAAGVTVALFAIFRELTSLWVSSETRVVNTKMLLSDFITMLALVVYLLLILRWFREKRGSFFYAFVSGGTLGLMLLLRSQTMFLAPGILILALLVFWPDWKGWILRSFIFAAGMILAVSPWLARNYAVTGKIALDDPNQILMVASMYSGGTPTSNNILFEGKTLPEISSYVVDTIVHRPGYVAGFVANQFLANTIDSLLVLPIFARYDGLTAPVYVYWFEWASYLSLPNYLLITIYLAIIAIGLAAAWKRLRWLGLLPLVLFLTYTFSTSMARFSGWRYIFPADWVPYFYFGLGAVELLAGLAVYFGADATRFETPPEPVPAIQPTRPARVILAACVFLLVGALPWIAEVGSPNKLLNFCVESTLGCRTAGQVTSSQETQAFFAQPGVVAAFGRVLYPRYFSRNDGLASTNPSPAYAPRDFPRTGFYFLVPGKMELAVLPMKGAHPFPNVADALLIGCQRDKYVEVKMIVFLDSGLTYTNGSLTDSCATP